MTVLRLLCSSACVLMMLAGLAYLAVVGPPMVRGVETGDRTP